MASSNLSHFLHFHDISLTLSLYNMVRACKKLDERKEMKMSFLHCNKKAILAAVLGMSCTAAGFYGTAAEAAGYTAPQPQTIKVLPIDNAKFVSKLQLEVAHFLKIKLRKSYRVHSRTNHLAFYTPKFF